MSKAEPESTSDSPGLRRDHLEELKQCIVGIVLGSEDMAPEGVRAMLGIFILLRKPNFSISRPPAPPLPPQAQLPILSVIKVSISGTPSSPLLLGLRNERKIPYEISAF